MEEEPGGPATAASTMATPRGEETPADFRHLRLEWQQVPVYGMESTKFTVEVHHGGYFLRSESGVTYMDEKSTVWFDNLDRNTFNKNVFDNLIDRLGYDKRKFVFWCPPGKVLDEMVEVVFEIQCKKMAKASVESKVLLLFLHHPDADEQEVKDELSHGESSEDSEQGEDFSCDSDEDPAWHDSDYDMKEDDDLYTENVDDSEADEMVDKGKQIAAVHAHVPGSDDVIEVDLELPVEDDSDKRHKSDSDDEEYKKKKKKKEVVYKFKPFNPIVDMDDPRFKTGREV